MNLDELGEGAIVPFSLGRKERKEKKPEEIGRGMFSRVYRLGDWVVKVGQVEKVKLPF